MSTAWTPSPRPVRRLSVHSRSLWQWSLDMDTKWAPFFLWGTWLEKQAETTKGYLSSEPGAGCRSQFIDLDRPGIVLVHAPWTPKTFFVLFCQPFYISWVSLFFFFLLFFEFCSKVALHKHWRMLHHLPASSACFDDGRYSPLVARFWSQRSYTCWLWTFSQRNFVWF